MTTTRCFTKKIPEKAADYHGGTMVTSLHPELTEHGISAINLRLTLEQALLLEKAVGDATSAVNRVNRATASGKARTVCLSIKVNDDGVVGIRVTESTGAGPAKRQKRKLVAVA